MTVLRDVRPWRRLLLLTHILTSVTWMALALALVALMGLAASTSDPTRMRAATAMTKYLDGILLAPMANSSVFTGLVLGLATPWGLVVHRWVLAKLVISVVQMHVAILLLSGWVDAAAERGTPVSAAQYVVMVAMPVAIAFQGWLSLAKPGGRTRWARSDDRGRPRKLPTASVWVYVAALLAVLVDGVLSVLRGHPSIEVQIAVLIAVAVVRRRALVRARRPAPGDAPVTTVGSL